MTIGAVSSYSYSTTVEYQYFGASLSDADIQQLLSDYGIQQSGDSDYDLEQLYDAMYSTAVDNAQNAQASSLANNTQQPQNSQAAEAQNSTNVPWANLMTQVGLYATGDLSTDYQAFNNKITAMQASGATSQQDKATIGQLVSEASSVFVQPTNSTPQVSSDQNLLQTSQAVSGADIMAQLNKMFLVG